MSLKLIQLVILLIGVAFAIVAYLPGHKKKILGIKIRVLAFIFVALASATLLMVTGLEFVGSRINLTVDSEELRAALIGIYHEDLEKLKDYHNGLPITGNKELRNLYEQGQEEEIRAAEYAEAIARGEEFADLQDKAATLKAIEYYRQGLDLNPTLGEQCALLVLMGSGYIRINQLELAKTAWQKALNCAEEMLKSEECKVEGEKAFSCCVVNLSIVYRITDNWESSKELWEKALNIYKDLGQKSDLAQAYYLLGTYHLYHARDIDKAEFMLLEALEIAEAAGKSKGLANIFTSLGDLSKICGDSTKAEEMYTRARDINEALTSK